MLPSIVLAASTLGLITRTTRAAMLEALSQDYVRVAHAKGLRRAYRGAPRAAERAAAGGDARRPGLRQLLSGTVLTETIFSWPGLGRYTFQSAVTLDFPAIMGITARGRDRLRAGQPGGRHVLRTARSAGDEEMSDAAALTARRAIALRPSADGCAATALAAVGGVVILAWLLAAVFAPWITPYDPNTVNVAGRLLPPSAGHWLGTDELGRDVLTRVIFGARISLAVGFSVVLIGGAVRHLARRRRRLCARLGRGGPDAR